MWLIDHVNDVLPAVELGTVVSLFAAFWPGAILFTEVINVKLGALLVGLLGSVDAAYIYHTLSLLGLCLFVLTILICCRLVPIVVALKDPERTLRAVSIPLRCFMLLLLPLVKGLRYIADLSMSPYNLKLPRSLGGTLRESAVSSLFAYDRTATGLDSLQQELLRGVVNFSSTTAREVMTPRNDIVSIPVTASLPEVLKVVADSGCSRFPVVKNNPDEVIGVLLVKDLILELNQATASQISGRAKNEFSVTRYMREGYFVPGTTSVSSLLAEFKRRKLHLAIVLDEHGGVDGIVTLEDILEEIVGDIFDESETACHAMVIREDNGDILIDGAAPVTQLNSRYSLGIPEGDYDTVAGFVVNTLGRMPKAGDQILVRQGEAAPFSYLGEVPKLVNAPVSTSGPADGALPKLSVFTIERVDSDRIAAIRCKRLPVHTLKKHSRGRRGKAQAY